MVGESQNLISMTKLGKQDTFSLGNDVSTSFEKVHYKRSGNTQQGKAFITLSEGISTRRENLYKR